MTPAAPAAPAAPASAAALPEGFADLSADDRAVLREAARQRLAVDTLSGFVRYLWSEIEPGKLLVWAWYMQLICDELEGLARGVAPPGHGGQEYQPGGAELVVCLPPGHAKSRLCSVFFPAWLWIHAPHLGLLTLANEGGLASRDSRLSRELITSAPYRALLLRKAVDDGEAVIDSQRKARPVIDGAVAVDQDWQPWGSKHGGTLAADQKAKASFITEGGGGRGAFGIMAKITGKRAEGMIVDDPHDAKEVLIGDPSRVAERMRETRIVYHGALMSRLNKGAWRLVVAQRLHVADLAGDLIKRGARVVCLPIHFDPEHPDVHALDGRDIGELLAPAVHGEVRDRDLRQRLTPRHHDAQYEQRPTAEAGGSFERSWFEQTYRANPVDLARRARFDEIAISLDCTFRDHAKADYVVAQVWGHKRRRGAGGAGRVEQIDGLRPGKYLLDQKRDRMGLFATCAMLRRLRAKWPWARLVLVEAKANGDAVIETMRREGHAGVVGFDPDRSKAARAEVSSLAFESGDIYLPDEQYAPWIGDYVEEHIQFPAGANDDQVDCTSQMCIRWALVDIDDIAGELGWVDLL